MGKSQLIFKNFEYRNRISKTITEIRINEKTSITNQEKILKTVKVLYDRLYKDSNHETPNPTTIPNHDPTKLTQEEKESRD